MVRKFRDDVLEKSDARSLMPMLTMILAGFLVSLQWFKFFNIEAKFWKWAPEKHSIFTWSEGSEVMRPKLESPMTSVSSLMTGHFQLALQILMWVCTFIEYEPERFGGTLFLRLGGGWEVSGEELGEGRERLSVTGVEWIGARDNDPTEVEVRDPEDDRVEGLEGRRLGTRIGAQGNDPT